MSKTRLLVAFLAAAVLPLIMSACAEAQIPAPALGIEQFSGAAHGPCRAPQIAVDITSGDFYTCLEPNWVFVGPGGSSSPAFGNLTAGTNTTAAMLVGSGASLKTTGTGQLVADGLPVLTVATLPVSPFSGELAFVTDGTSATDCTTGGASTVVLCRYTGTAWSGYAGGGSGSGTVNTGTQYAATYYATAGTAVSALAAPTANGHYFLSYDVTGGVAVAPAIEQAGITAGTVNGSATTYTFAAGDEGTFVIHDKSSTGAVTIALPTPTTLVNPNYDSAWCNNSPQTDTLTPAGSWTIAVGNGTPGTTATIASGECGRFFPDPHVASQWDLIPSFTTNSGGSSAFSALTGGTNTTAAMLVGSGASLGPTGTGTVNANQLQGVNVSATAPTTNQVLTYNGTQAAWAPAGASVNFFTPRDRTWQELIVNNGHNRVDEIGFANTTTGTLTFSLSNIDAKANSFATIVTGTVASTKDGVSSSGNAEKLAIPGLAYSFQGIAGINTTASVNSWVALSSDQSVADLAGNVDPGASATTVVGFRYFAATDTTGHWQCYISAGTAGEVIDSGVAIDTVNLQTFDVIATAAGAINFYINDTAVCGSPVTPTAGHVPSLSMAPLFAIENTTTTSVTGSIAKLYVGAN